MRIQERKTTNDSELLEVWKLGLENGFKIGAGLRIVPVDPTERLVRTMPFKNEPCLHRVLAECSPEPVRIVEFVGRYGLLRGRVKDGIQSPRAHDFVEIESINVWREQIAALNRMAGLLDRVRVKDRTDRDSRKELSPADRGARRKLVDELQKHLGRFRFQPVVTIEDESTTIRYRPLTLLAGLWQRFAEEAAGTLCCQRCPTCANWFVSVPSQRRDRQYCSNKCRQKKYRSGGPQRK